MTPKEWQRRRATVDDIANPHALVDELEQELWLVRFDDRGDLNVFVWGETPRWLADDAVEEAEDYGVARGWRWWPDDVLVEAIHDDEARGIVAKRSFKMQEARLSDGGES